MSKINLGSQKQGFLPGGGGGTTIYAGTGCAVFWGASLEQKINFGVSLFQKNNSLGY